MHTIIREIADDDRAYDPWGAGTNALGAVCDVLATEGEPVPSEAGYRLSPVAGPIIDTDPDTGDHAATTVLAALNPGDFPGFWVDGYTPGLTVADLQYAARILSRYLDWVRLAGRDY